MVARGYGACAIFMATSSAFYVRRRELITRRAAESPAAVCLLLSYVSSSIRFDGLLDHDLTSAFVLSDMDYTATQCLKPHLPKSRSVFLVARLPLPPFPVQFCLKFVEKIVASGCTVGHNIMREHLLKMYTPSHLSRV